LTTTTTTTQLTTTTTTTQTTTAVITTTSTTTESTTTTSTTSQSTTTVSTTTAAPYVCPGGSLGSYCNISSDACAMSQPCLNAATCFPNNTLPLGYECQCQTGYAGENCQTDERICKDDTCW